MTAMREFGLTYPSLRDPDGSYVRDFGQTGYPETYVLDRRGRVAAVRRFPVTQEWLDRTLPPLLEERV
jgi:cytochrome c biogenesis protein CcmG/thiol:disulfide interchange protein DsbE